MLNFNISFNLLFCLKHIHTDNIPLPQVFTTKKGIFLSCKGACRGGCADYRVSGGGTEMPLFWKCRLFCQLKSVGWCSNQSCPSFSLAGFDRWRGLFQCSGTRPCHRQRYGVCFPNYPVHAACPIDIICKHRTNQQKQQQNSNQIRCGFQQSLNSAKVNRCRNNNAASKMQYCVVKILRL